jgi:anaerobic ribonucleoside-triphosphate reductase activating protein
VPVTHAEGPGLRFAIWFQGCPFRCPGCCNPEMLSFEGGERSTVGNVLDQLQRASESDSDLEGITLLGGEPFAHAPAAELIARGAKHLNLSVMIFTGYRLDELEKDPDEAKGRLLAQTDLLVDGLYERDQPDRERRWIGSTNQRVHSLTDRYSLEDPCWQERDTLEIRLENNNLSINGFPARSAVGFWKRLGTKKASRR